MGYIYQITNIINGKIYIGQTKNSIEERFQQHYYARNNSNTLLHKAIKKYGITNFKVEMLEECSNDILSEREIYWIEQKQSMFLSGRGYNMTYGGEGSNLATCKKVRAISPDGDFYDFNSVNEAGRSLNQKYGNLFDGKIISKICNGIGNTHHKWHFYFLDENDNIIYPNKERRKSYRGKILAINLETKEQTIFNSATEAGKSLNIDRRRISEVISGIKKKVCGYTFQKLN